MPQPNPEWNSEVKPSKLFEGENSSLRRTFNKAINPTILGSHENRMTYKQLRAKGVPPKKALEELTNINLCPITLKEQIAEIICEDYEIHPLGDLALKIANQILKVVRENLPEETKYTREDSRDFKTWAVGNNSMLDDIKELLCRNNFKKRGK